jgi:putative glycerol-1-phosphate prenyltransferase
MNMSFYQQLLNTKLTGKKSLSVLIDPDKLTGKQIDNLTSGIYASAIDCFFVGSSLLLNNTLPSCIRRIKSQCEIPVILFPGNSLQVCNDADAILFLSLISGRNSEFLIGQHVLAAPSLKASTLEIVPTGYMLIDSVQQTSVNYMSQTLPIPHHKNDIAVATALAGEMLGMKAIYMDAGSGANLPVSTSMIEAVKQSVSVPLIVGGGIRTPEKALQNCLAGADMIVIGNAVEKDPELIHDISSAVHSLQTS